MKIFEILRQQKGQAMAEMVLAIPLLFLLTAGMVQFALLFLSYIQFDHACGEAARYYVDGKIDKNSLGPTIINNLGTFKRYFDSNSLNINLQASQSDFSKFVEKGRSLLGNIPFVMDYDGATWKVRIFFNPPFLFRPLFPNGVPFMTTMQVYRYPK